MRRVLAAALLAASLLAVTSSAQAKAPPSGFQVCGPAACVGLHELADAEPLAIGLFYGADGSAELWSPNVPPGTFYAVHWSFDQGQTHTGYYVPLLNAFRYVGDVASPTDSANGRVHWIKLGPDTRTILERITSTLQPFPAPAPSRVTVGGKAVQDPATYLRLWSVGKPTYAWPGARFMAIKATCDQPTPWTDAAAHLSVARRGPYLLREDTVLRIPAQLAKRIRARLSLH